MNLFALSEEPARRILRIPLAQNIQTEVEALFRQQEQEFRHSVDEEHAFDGKYKPDDGECLVISDFDDIDNIHGAIAHPLGIPEISPDPAEFATIKALFSGYQTDTGERVALIQGFDRRKIISSAGISIFHSANVYRKVDGVGLTLDSRLAAILAGNSLKFFSFHFLRQVFDLSAYYVEATTADLQAFAQLNSVHFTDAKAFVDTADAWIRRKVTLISQSQILDKVDPATIQRVARTFGIDLQTVPFGGHEAIVMPAGKADLKKVLRFLDEDYYQSALQSRNFVTNSKRPA